MHRVTLPCARAMSLSVTLEMQMLASTEEAGEPSRSKTLSYSPHLADFKTGQLEISGELVTLCVTPVRETCKLGSFPKLEPISQGQVLADVGQDSLNSPDDEVQI